METVAVRLKKISDLDFFGKILDEKRSEVIRNLIDEGRKMKALELYKQNKVSLEVASKLAGVTLGEFFDLLEEYKIKLNMTLDDAKEAMKNAREFFKTNL